MSKTLQIILAISIFLVFLIGVPALIGIGFYKLIQEPLPQLCLMGNCTHPEPVPIIIESPAGIQVPTQEWHIVRVPQTIGLAPGESGITPGTPYRTTLPAKLSQIPYVQGKMYGDNVTWALQDIIELNKGQDIVISFGDTWCGACLGVIKNFGDFEAAYGNELVKFVAVMENDPGRLEILINKYRLNTDVIFVSDIANLDAYHSIALQGYMYRPIVIHINPEGIVDRVLVSSFGSLENLKKFIGIEPQKVN